MMIVSDSAQKVRPYIDDLYERYIFCDTETTGLSPAEGDKIVEFCFYETDRYGDRISELHTLVNPRRPIPQVVVDIHGIDNAKVAGAPVFADIAPDIAAFLTREGLPKEKQCIVIHNADFDVGFIENEMRLCPGFADFKLSDYADIIDSVHTSRRLYPSQRASLNAVCERLQIDTSARTLHGALLDCQLLAEAYVGMCHLLQERQRERLASVDQFEYDGPMPTALVPLTSCEVGAHTDILGKLKERDGGSLDTLMDTDNDVDPDDGNEYESLGMGA